MHCYTGTDKPRAREVVLSKRLVGRDDDDATTSAACPACSWTLRTSSGFPMTMPMAPLMYPAQKSDAIKPDVNLESIEVGLSLPPFVVLLSFFGFELPHGGAMEGRYHHVNACYFGVLMTAADAPRRMGRVSACQRQQGQWLDRARQTHIDGQRRGTYSETPHMYGIIILIQLPQSY